MTSPSERNEIYGLETENRHLKEMIGALRDEMEKMRLGEQGRLQQSLTAASDEIGQLKKTITALRDELERRNIEYEGQCRAIEQAARDEVKQLRNMIGVMRDALEGYEKK
ncbi:MAG TPA: hypothetical protein VJZ49_13980 [Syntrophales bacterium]|nr:hypothetical protein [Syntrophales bacterium]